jgi:hypothetical protein
MRDSLPSSSRGSLFTPDSVPEAIGLENSFETFRAKEYENNCLLRCAEQQSFREYKELPQQHRDITSYGGNESDDSDNSCFDNKLASVQIVSRVNMPQNSFSRTHSGGQNGSKRVSKRPKSFGGV